MKKILLLSTCLLCSCIGFREAQSHLEFLREQPLTADEYVLGEFRDHDLVVFCERHHSEFTQYELLLDVVSDPWFIENVGHIFTEVGSINREDRLNAFLIRDFSDSLSRKKEITELFRDITFVPYWHCYNFPWFLEQLQILNQTLPPENKIRIHPVDRAFDWSEIHTAADYAGYEESWPNRDSLMAQHIIRRFEEIEQSGSSRKKGLVIMNFKHAFLKRHMAYGGLMDNTGQFLADRYGDRVAGIYLMGLAIPEYDNYTVVKDGLWDHYFETSGKTDVGFDLEGSPFGPEVFDVFVPDSLLLRTYEEMFTGLIFYKPVQEHVLVTGWEGFVDDGFLPEMERRIRIFAEAEGMEMSGELLEEKIWENNTVRRKPYADMDKIRAEIDRWNVNTPE